MYIADVWETFLEIYDGSFLHLRNVFISSETRCRERPPDTNRRISRAPARYCKNLQTNCANRMKIHTRFVQFINNLRPQPSRPARHVAARLSPRAPDYQNSDAIEAVFLEFPSKFNKVFELLYVNKKSQVVPTGIFTRQETSTNWENPRKNASRVSNYVKKSI